MALPANSIMEARIRYAVNGQDCYNVLHYLRTAGGGAANEIPATQAFLDKIANNVAGQWPFELKKVLASNAVINLVSAQLIFPTRFQTIDQVVNVGGTDDFACNAQNLASVITKRGIFANRHNQGSLHTGGMPVGSYVAGNLDAAYEAKLAFYISNFLSQDVIDNVNTVTWTPAILNKEKVIVSGKPKWNITGASVVVTWGNKSTLRTQRTRNKGVGV